MTRTKKIIRTVTLSILVIGTAAYALMYSNGSLYKGQLMPINSGGMNLNGYKVVIETPENDNLNISYKNRIRLRASVQNQTGKNVQNMRIKWESNRDGHLGDGAEISTHLSKGTHIINCIATDSRGNESSSTINITAKNVAPQLLIQQPASFDSFAYGNPIPMQVDIDDFEDHFIPDVAVSWKSNIDGDIGRGKSLTIEKLSPGTHKITVTAKDSEGLETSASTTISID